MDLPIQVTGPDAVLLELPAAATIAPPGWYLLFVVSAAGVPSVGSSDPPAAESPSLHPSIRQKLERRAG